MEAKLELEASRGEKRPIELHEGAFIIGRSAGQAGITEGLASKDILGLGFTPGHEGLARGRLRLL